MFRIIHQRHWASHPWTSSSGRIEGLLTATVGPQFMLLVASGRWLDTLLIRSRAGWLCREIWNLSVTATQWKFINSENILIDLHYFKKHDVSLQSPSLHTAISKSIRHTTYEIDGTFSASIYWTTYLQIQSLGCKGSCTSPYSNVPYISIWIPDTRYPEETENKINAKIINDTSETPL